MISKREQGEWRAPFNMIEIVVALGIILVSLVSVMGLIPSAVNSSRDAVGRSNAADAADQFLHYMASRVEANTAEAQAFPDTKPTLDDENLVFSAQSLITEAKVKVYFEAPNELAAWDPAVNNTGIFRIVQMTMCNVADFEGILRTWKQVTEYGTAEDWPKSIILYAEVSWPAARPYAERTKANYEMEIFKSGVMISEATQEYNDECNATGQMTGNIDVTPSNSEKAEFFMVLANGTKLTRDDLLELGPDFTYTGAITYACFRPRGKGNGLEVGGDDYNLKNVPYVLEGDSVNVHLYNDKQGMGHWHLDVLDSTADAHIDLCKVCGN